MIFAHQAEHSNCLVGLREFFTFTGISCLFLIDAAKKHQAGELAQTAKLYNEYIEKRAESVEALSLFGLCMRGMGDHRHAETLFQKRLSADNTRYELYQNRGTTRLQMGKLVEALSDFESGLSIFPNDIDSLKNAGAICIKLNEFDRAVLFLKEPSN